VVNNKKLSGGAAMRHVIDLRSFLGSVLLVTALLLAGCNSSGDDATTSPGDETFTVSGVVANGRVTQASVEVRGPNPNSAVIASTVTDEDGNFTVEVRQGPPYRISTHGGTLNGKAYTGELHARCESPGGCAVTPLSTVIVRLIDNHGFTASSAPARLAELFGCDIFADGDPFLDSAGTSDCFDTDSAREEIEGGENLDEWVDDVVDSVTAFPVVAAGWEHSVAIKADGTLWSWGENRYGQLGRDTTITAQHTPAQVGTEDDWVAVSAGEYHNLAIKSDGTLWAWGRNGDGQLGLGGTIQENAPVQVGSDSDWVAVSAGGYHTLAMKADGTLWGWGRNDSGQLGLGYTNPLHSPVPHPVQVQGDNSWVAVTAGERHTVAIKADGTLWAWGANDNGQLGLGHVFPRPYPEQVGSDADWRSVTARTNHSLAIKADGTLWAWGRNGDGQLGLGDTSLRIVPVKVDNHNGWAAVSTGARHTLAVRHDGTLWAWGDNGIGQLGLDGTSRQILPAQVGDDADWAAVSAGAYHTLAIKHNATLWAWGWNSGGQLGVGDTARHSGTMQVLGEDWGDTNLSD
jgi:alpha-tubulin suppressor-like RCC1 family protein